MTREEFIGRWFAEMSRAPKQFLADLDALLSATESAARKAALEEAWNIADAHECVPMGGCRCGTHIMEAIAKAKENQ